MTAIKNKPGGVVAITANTTLSDTNHKGKTLEVSGAFTITIPTGLSADFYCNIVRTGTSDVTIAAGSGVTLRNGTANKIKTQHFGATLYHTATLNTFHLIGTEA